MIYKLLAVFLLGMIVGLIIGAKWLAGDEYKAYIRKIRQRGKGNATSTVVFKPVLDAKDKSNSKLSLRERRAENKAERQARKANSQG